MPSGTKRCFKSVHVAKSECRATHKLFSVHKEIVEGRQLFPWQVGIEVRWEVSR